MSEGKTGGHEYRKKPVVIEARQLASDNATELWRWVGTSVGSNGIRDVIVSVDDSLLIDTLEGTMKADFGDWIIKGVKGEFYPCKPDIFEATYEPAAAAAASAAAHERTAELVSEANELRAEVTHERAARIHIAAGRDEARSDFSRLRAVLLDSRLSDAVVRKRCLAILQTAGTPPMDAPLDAQRTHRPGDCQCTPCQAEAAVVTSGTEHLAEQLHRVANADEEA